MECSGAVVLAGPPEKVRALLRDRRVLGRLIPAWRDLREVGPGAYVGALVVGLPPLGQRYPVRIVAAEDEGGMRVSAVGTGRAEGLSVEADCRLGAGPAARTTALGYRVRADFGRLAWLSNLAGPHLVSDFLAGLGRELVGDGSPGGQTMV